MMLDGIRAVITILACLGPLSVVATGRVSHILGYAKERYADSVQGSSVKRFCLLNVLSVENGCTWCLDLSPHTK